MAREHLYPACRPGYKEFTDDDPWLVLEGPSYDYYDIYVNHPEGSLNDRYGQFLLKGGNSSGHSQLIALYPANADDAIVNEGDKLKGQKLNGGNIFASEQNLMLRDVGGFSEEVRFGARGQASLE